MKQNFLVDTAETFKTYVWQDNQRVVPSSATLTVYQPGSDTILVNAQSMTVAGDGLLSYSLTTTHNDVADENYKVVISYVLSGITYVATLFYDVVNSKLHMVITDEDLINELPQIKEQNYRVFGTADSGSTTTIVDANLTIHEDDFFTGGLATSLTLGETREISDFVKSTGTVTTAAFGTAIATDKYILQRSYLREIIRAFEKIKELLRREGRIAHLILDPYDLREVHIQFAIAEICKSFIASDDSMWYTLWMDYKKTSYAMFKNLNLKYDDSNDGTISGSEESRRGTRTLGRG